MFELMNLSAALLLAVLSRLLSAAAAGRWVARWSAFEIEGITVTGDTHYNNSVTLRANVAPRISGTFFTVDLASVRRAFESAPWVRRAVVHREFPNRLRVVLQEQQSAALWGSEGELRLINRFGEVFEANVDEVDARQPAHLERSRRPGCRSAGDVPPRWHRSLRGCRFRWMPLKLVWRRQLDRAAGWRRSDRAGTRQCRRGAGAGAAVSQDPDPGGVPLRTRRQRAWSRRFAA